MHTSQHCGTVSAFVDTSLNFLAKAMRWSYDAAEEASSYPQQERITSQDLCNVSAQLSAWGSIINQNLAKAQYMPISPLIFKFDSNFVVSKGP
jgi:penicillin V acylase-like amidase (Ntn superfamily)